MNLDLSQALTRCPGCGQDILLSLSKCPNCGAAADTSSLFLSMRYPAGGGGMIDQQTASFLRSSAPEPSQAVLDALLDRTDGVILKELVVREKIGNWEPVLEITSPAHLASLRSALRINPTQGHLMSAPSHALECRASDNSVVTLELVGLFVLRWPGRWKSDATLAEPDALADFFSSLGYRRLREDLDKRRVDAERRARENKTWARSWNAATPAGLAGVVESLSHERYALEAPERDRALRILATVYPSIEEQILALFGWYAHSLGPWSGFPSEEVVPEYLLEAFSQDAVVAAARRSDLTANQLEGAARFFCRWAYDPVRKKKVKLPSLPADVRQKLWAYVTSTGDQNKIQRAQRILGQS